MSTYLASGRGSTGRRFSAIACEGPGGLPVFWRKIVLTFKSGHVASLVYVTEPDDPSELPELMWAVQVAAGRHGFAVEIVDADGTVTAAPAIRPAGAR